MFQCDASCYQKFHLRGQTNDGARFFRSARTHLIGENGNSFRVLYSVSMHVSEVGLSGLKLVTSDPHRDDRGWFAEAYNCEAFAKAGLPVDWAQDNQSSSCRGVLRGLHFQTRRPQGKLIRVLSGCIWDAVVDLRRNSPDFGRWFGMTLQAPGQSGSLEMLWIPEGFAHGFLVLSDHAEVLYKVTEPYDPGGEQTLLWNDPSVAVGWPLDRLEGARPVLSAKDAAGLPLGEVTLF